MTRSTLRPLPGNLAQRVTWGAGAFFGFDSDPALGAVEASRHPYSSVFRVELRWPSASRWLYVKLPPKNARNAQILTARLSTEYQILTELARHFQADPHLGVVTPYAFFEEPLAIATVQAEGPTLRRLLGRHARAVHLPSHRRALIAAASRCGTWLREFQEATAADTAAFDHDELIVYCRPRIETLVKHPSSGVDDFIGAELLARLAEAGRAGIDNRICGRHNDFAAHNIIVGDDAIRVLDFSMFDRGPAVFDPCNFWLELELLKAAPTYSGSLIAELQRAFLEAYGLIDPGNPLFALARCRYVINRFLTTLDTPPRRLLASMDRRRVLDACRTWLIAFARHG